MVLIELDKYKMCRAIPILKTIEANVIRKELQINHTYRASLASDENSTDAINFVTHFDGSTQMYCTVSKESKVATKFISKILVQKPES